MGGNGKGVLVALVAAVALAGQPAVRAGDGAVRYAGTGCTGFELGFPADPERLPTGRFAPILRAGAALVTIEVVRCASGAVNGEPITSFRNSLTSTFVEPVEGGFERYVFSQQASRAAIDAVYDELGIPSAVVKGLTLTTAPVVPSVHDARGAVPGHHVLEGSAADAGVPLTSATSVFWYERPSGEIVRLSCDVVLREMRPAHGTVQATAGSITADLLGSDPLQGVGVEVDYDFDCAGEVR